MKTVLINKPFEIAVTDTPAVKANEGEALLKIMYGGICADVASYTGNQPFTTYPRIPDTNFPRQSPSPKTTGDLRRGTL